MRVQHPSLLWHHPNDED